MRFELERKLNEWAENRTQLWIDGLFDIFQVDERNLFIQKLIPILPLASEIRSNKMIWKDILQNVFYPAKVDRRIARKPNVAGLMRNFVRANIHIEGLSNREFRKIKKDVDPFAQFFYEWFMLADMGCEFKVKDVKERFVLGREMMLDYNMQLKDS